MSDYKQTRDAAGNVTTQYDKMLRNLDDDLVKQLREGEEFAIDPTQSKVNIGPINDPIYIGEAKPFGTSVVQDIKAQLAEQIEWVKDLADDLIAAEGREARLKAKLAQQDDLVQAAVAAALLVAADAIAEYPRVAPDAVEAEHYDEQIEHSQSIILALITPDAQAALDRVVAEERERCAKVAQQQAQAAQKEVTRLMKEHGSKTAEDIWTGRLIAAQEINAAIRKGGE